MCAMTFINLVDHWRIGALAEHEQFTRPCPITQGRLQAAELPVAREAEMFAMGMDDQLAAEVGFEILCIVQAVKQREPKQANERPEVSDANGKDAEFASVQTLAHPFLAGTELILVVANEDKGSEARERGAV